MGALGRTFGGQLVDMGACAGAREWVGDKPLVTAWAECPRGDWMLWFVGRAGIDRKLLVLAACDVAETVLKYVRPGEEHSRKAIGVARAWARGEATIQEARKARAAADAAAAAYAAAYTIADAYAARTASQKETADLVRTRIPLVAVQAALENS